MKIKPASADFIDFANKNAGQKWHLDLMPWPQGYEVVWTIGARQLPMDHVEARKVARVLRAHFQGVFRTVAKEKRQPAFEAECIRFCDSLDDLAKQCLHHNRQVRA